MVGLQTSHRYGNATLLASDFVLGIGNRWANRHTGGLDVYRRGRTFVHVDIEPTQIGRVFAAGLRDRLRRGRGAGRCSSRWPASARRQAAATTAPGSRSAAKRKHTMQRRTHFDNVPIKPQRVYEEMNRAFGRDTRYVSHDRPVADRGGAVPARLPAAALDQRRAGGPAGLDAAGRAGRRGGRPGHAGGGAVRRLRLPVHDRGAGGGRAVQPALHPRAGEQRLPGADPAVAARLRHGLLRAAGVRQRQQPRARRLRRRPRQGGRGPGLQGAAGARARATSRRRSRRRRS